MNHAKISVKACPPTKNSTAIWRSKEYFIFAAGPGFVHHQFPSQLLPEFFFRKFFRTKFFSQQKVQKKSSSIQKNPGQIPLQLPRRKLKPQNPPSPHEGG